MKQFTLPALALLTAFWACFTLHANGQQLRTEGNAQGVRVKAGNKPVLFYQKTPKSHDGKYTRNHYIHPLYGLDGEVLTEDFPEDHLHQRGIFWAWHQVRVQGHAAGDMWTTEDFVWNVKTVKLRQGPSHITLNPVVYWQSPRLKNAKGKMIPFLKESTLITVYPAKSNYRIIDFAIHLKPLKDSIKIGGADNEKGYGGFSARIKLPENIRFTADYGHPTPKQTAVKASKWMDFSATFSEKTGKSGITIITHPNNPAFPPKWILRDKGSMQNPVYPGRKPVLLKKHNPVTLRYRLVIHRNGPEAVPVKNLFKKFQKK